MQEKHLYSHHPEISIDHFKVCILQPWLSGCLGKGQFPGQDFS